MKLRSEFLTMSEYNIELLPISECLKESEFSMEPDIIEPSEDQMKLLAYIITSSCKNLQELLARRKTDINYYYEKPYKKTALEILCSEYPTDANVKCVKLLIDNGANAEDALEAAVQGGNAKILKLLLDQVEKEQVDMYEKKLIIALIKHIESNGKNEADYVEVLQLLLPTGINMNAIDSNGCTGVYLAAKYKFEKLIQVFLTYSDINLDILPIKAKRTARELISRNNLYTGKLPINSKQSSSNRSILDENIRQKQQSTFIKNYSYMKSNLMQTENYPYQTDLRYSYLCEASESGLDSIVQYLLCDGVDIDTEEEISESPLYLATMNGYYKVVKTLLEYSSTLTVSHTFVRMLALHKMDTEPDKNISYRQCFDYYLDSEQLDINYCLSDKDRKLEGKTALYFAIKNQNEEIVIMILRKGASLVYLYPWEVFLDTKTLIKYLNESIMPQESKPTTKIQITALLPSEKDEEEPETKVLRYFCKTPELHPVLHHPVIQILLSLKWKTVRTFYDINLIVFLMFSVSMMLYVILGYNNAKELCPAAVEICLFLITLSYIILIFRELLQVYIFRKEYFTNYENYIEIGILSITAKILTLDPNERKPFNQYAAILIVLTATESLLLIGRQTPLLFISITVLKTVSRTLIKWLFPYFLIVIAFSSSFFLLFKKECNTEKCSENDNHFSDIYKSFVRTAVMLTGEFEVGNLNFDIYPVTSPFVFIIYVFWMNTVLFGVCTALAFSETQILMKNAEVRKEIYRIEHIAHWETVLRTNKTIQNFLKVEKLFQKNSLIIELTKGSKVYILNNPDPYKKLKSYLPHCMHHGIEVICRDDLPYIIYLEKKVVKDIASLIDEQKQKKKAWNFR